jgi:hypothetical protein
VDGTDRRRQPRGRESRRHDVASDGGGDNWAVIASLIECCKLNSVDPYAYLADVLAKIVDGHLNSAIDDLLPWAYVASQPFKAVA